MSDLGSMACESDGLVDAEVSQRLNHTSGGDHVSDEDTLPFVVKYYTSEETKCTFQLSNEDDDEIYSLFLDVVSEIVDALTERDTKTFCKFLNPLPDLKKELQDFNKKRRGWRCKTDDDRLLQRVLDKINSSAKELICPYQAHGKITCLDVTVQDDFDPTGELQKVIETNAAEVSDTESEAGEDTSIGEEKDDCVVDENPPNQGKEIDDATRSNPENPCYFPTQIEMAAILKQRIEAIMDYYHDIANLSDHFDDIDFTVYTARYRMLSDQTEQRLCHPDAGVLSKEEVMLHKERKGKKRMFMYGHGEDADKHFEHLKKEVKDKEKTLFIIIADECHWGITKDKDQKQSAHNLFINDWCEESPRNVVVVQISATPFNLLTQDSRLPEVRCLVLHDKVTTTRKTYEAGDLLVEETEPEIEERVKETAREVELHVVDWSEVEVKNFERGMRMKLKSTLSEKGVRSLCRQVSPDAKLDESPEEGDYLSAYLQVLPDGNLHITPGDEADATVFEVQGSHGIVTIKAVVSEEQVLTLTKDESGSLKAIDNPSMPTQFRVKLEYGVGVVAFVCSDGSDLYLTVNELDQVQLQPAKVESKGGVVITKPINDLGEVSFEFYMVHCGPKEVDMVGRQYVSLNYYLSTMNSKDQKIRQDEYFQKIVKNAKKQGLSKIDFTVDAMLCAEYSYYVLHMSTYDSDDKVRQALTAGMDKSPSAQFCETLKSFVRILTKNTSCIHHEVFEWVQIKLREKVKDDFKTDCEALQKFKSLNDDGPESKKCKEELVDSFVACLMHLSPQELGELREKYADVKLIEEELKENNFEKLVKIWNTIVQESETDCLVQSLIHSGEQGSGKMKIVRAKSRKTADQFFFTLSQARRLASKEECFEIIRDYGKFNLKRLMTSSNTFFQKLQPRKCQFQFECHCSDLKLHPGRPKCGNCQHVHKPITQYEDLQNLACVLILVDKGRMGDTFPESFDCLDLRLSYDEGSPIVLSTVIQELGRMCRYAKLSTDGSFVQNVPYALVGAQLFKRLKMSLDLSPAVRAISCTTVDRYMKNSKSKRKHSTSLRWSKFQADKESYDYQNKDKKNNKHCNRILLQAEPQIGKTGTYLCLIKQLRQDILKESDEGNFYLVKESSASEGHHVMNGNNEAEDWNFPYWKTIQESPSLLQKSVGPGKYSIGGRFYTHDTTNFPFILTKSEGLSQLTKTVYHRQVDNIPTGAVRAWHWYHFLNCAECGRFLEGKEPELQSIKVNIDGKPVTVKCSVPASRRPYKYLLEKLPNFTSQGEVWTEDSLASAIRSVRSSLFWIFHPSHRDDPCKCLLNYHHALQHESMEITYFQVAVVRSEKFQDDVSTWGKMLVIFQLPDQLPMEGEDEDVGPSEGGIGYARRFIQEMAFALKLEYVFMLDDNVAVMSEALVSSRGPATCNDTVIRNDDGVIRMEPCSFWRPLNYLQKIVRGKDEPPDVKKQYEAHPLTEEFDRDFPLYRYTGPAKLFGDKLHESYGVLGFLRSVPNAVRPFAKTQVYAAILLNVKSTVEKRVLYQPWPCWEDLRFNDDCDKEGLWVVKCNRFRFHKVQYRDWINSLVLPGIFQWTADTKAEKQLPESMLPIDFEEGIILEHLRGLVNVEGNENCFKGEIGYSDSQDSGFDISPMHLLKQLRINQDVNYARAKPLSILFLAYSVLNPAIADISRLEKLYCLAEKKIVFIVSAQEAEDEWKNNIRLDCLDRTILKTCLMRNRKANFALFSAADPSRHRLRWMVIEASFKGEYKSISDANTTQGIMDGGVNELASSDESKSSVTEKRGSKRSVEVIVDGANENTWQTSPSGKEDVEEMVVDPNASYNQLESEQHTGILFPPSTPSNSKRVTPSSTPVSSKKRKIEDYYPNCTSKNTESPEMKVKTVTTSLTHSAKAEEKESCSAVRLGQSPTNEDSRGVEAVIEPSKPQEKVLSATRTPSHSVKRKTPKGARQQDVELDVPSTSKRTKSQVTGLTPEDPAYIRGTSEVTRSIVELWREKMRQKKDLDPETIKDKLKNFENEDLEELDKEGFSALTKACSLPSMSLRIVSYLLNTKMVDINSQLPEWFTTGDREDAKLIPQMSALSVALLRGNVRCVSTFLRRKGVIKFDSRDQKGNTALHYCLSTQDAFKDLWPNYEKMNWRDMKNDDGKNPCDDAKEKYENSSPKIETKKKKVTTNKTREALEFAISRMDPEWLKNK
ncbi:unnamed protein product, partial [Porites evermanni]